MISHLRVRLGGEPAVAMGEMRMNASQREHFAAWAVPFVAATAGRVRYLPGDLFHFWHGFIRDRRYRQRYRGIECFRYDPAKDIRVGPGGAYLWSSDKPGLHNYLRDYFAGRDEDGVGQQLASGGIK